MFALNGMLKAYAGRPALGPLTLTVPPGRTTVLIGPSGCGKSTFLRLLVGLVRPDAGEVTFDGKPVTPATVRAVRLRVGYVIQDDGLFPHFTARENVTLMARHLGRARDTIAARVAKLTDLTHFPADGLDRYPHELSGGQRQRVGLMRALMLNPDALLLDEPLAALDPLVRADLQTELRDIFRRLDKTVVLVTHDLAEAAFLPIGSCSSRAGQVVQEGSPADLWHNPANAFVTRFVQAQRGPEGGGVRCAPVLVVCAGRGRLVRMPAAGRNRPVVIGAKKFTESVILAEMGTQLARHAGSWPVATISAAPSRSGWRSRG